MKQYPTFMRQLEEDLLWMTGHGLNANGEAKCLSLRHHCSCRNLMYAHFCMHKGSNQRFEVKDGTGNTENVEDLMAVEEVIELTWLVVALRNLESIYQGTGDVAHGLVKDVHQLDSVDGLLDAEVEATGDDGKKP